MKGLLTENSRVWLRPSDNPKRKLKWSWEIATEGETLVGINTSLPNALVSQSIEAGDIPSLTGYGQIKREVKYGQNSRIDVFLSKHVSGEADCYVEVKNVTLAEKTQARFPDAVTSRGLKHLKELQLMVAQGHRAMMLYLVQRGDTTTFAPADDIDPAYAEALKEAFVQGVEVEAWRARVDPISVSLECPLSVQI
jgi:sugar fermentation stimulation protein A